VRNSNEHIQATAQHLSDEDSLTMACFANLLDETIEVERRSSRLRSNRHSNAIKNVLGVKNELEIEANIRFKQDSVLLDTIIESQRMLQQTVRINEVLENSRYNDIYDKYNIYRYDNKVKKESNNFCHCNIVITLEYEFRKKYEFIKPNLIPPSFLITLLTCLFFSSF
jgi:hypothetical protein